MRWLSFVYPILWLIGIIACKEKPYLKEAISGPDKKVYYKDFRLALSTVRYSDSVFTQNDSLLLIGRYRDPAFGNIKTTGIASLNQRNLVTIINTGRTDYDSIVFELVFKHSYGKRSGSFGLSIHPLTAALSTDKIYVAETRSAHEKEVEVLSTSFPVATGIVDTVRRHANKTWADDFFTRLTGEDGLDFLLNYPGFAFIPKDNNETILGLNPRSTSMTLYYKQNPEDEKSTVSNTFDFAYLRYNSYEIDLSQSILESLGHRVHSVRSDGDAYAQAAGGIFCGIDLSSVLAFYKQNGGFTVNIAQLSVGPLQNPSNDTDLLSPPEQLRLSLPYVNPADPSNHALNLIDRLIRNEDGSLPGKDDFLHSASETALLFKGNVASALQDHLLADERSKYWLLSAADYNGFEPIILSQQQVLLKLYYTLHK